MRQLTTSTTRLTAALGLTVALVAGCSDDDGTTALETPSPTDSPAASPSPTATPGPSPTDSPTASPTQTDGAEWATCTSTRAGLQVSYPADWVARDYPDGGCAYFDPEPFDVERGTEAPSVAVRLDVESVEYDRVLSAYTEGEVISQEETEVAGYPAVRVEDRDTGGPLGPKGQRLTYIADLGNEKTLLLTTNETDADDPERARQVVDEMAERLERTS